MALQSAEFEDKDAALRFHGATDVQSKPLCPMEADHDSGAAALGDGLRGYGAPLVSSMLGKRRDYTDGFGLCSPGRWQPSMRRCADDTPSLAFAEALGVELLKLLNSKLNIRELMFKLAAGKVTACPFDAELIEDGRELIFKALEYVGTQLPVRVQPDGQPFFLAAVEEVLRISGDPDFSAFYSGPDSFAKGVRLGVGVETPRVPAVFEEKTRFRKYGEDADWEDTVRENYLSAKDHADIAQTQCQEEAKLGAMVELPLSEARERFGDRLVLASLGAIEKKDGTYRVIHDGTHGVGVNSAIRMRDQVRSPTAGDVRTAMRVLQRARFGLTGDVSRAHRLVKVAEEDWGLQACRTGVGPGESVWLNKVGTFGVSSASYHWSRLTGGLGRSAQYLLGKIELMHLVYVDDLLCLLKNVKRGMDCILLQIFFYVLLGLPFSWRKFRGGVEFCWVGFTICLKERSLGISARRADWLVSWLSKAACEKCVCVADL